MELSITGQVLQWARQSNLSGELSLSKADGWNLQDHSPLTAARHLREKTHPSMLVVTIREGEARGICSAALKELLKLSKIILRNEARLSSYKTEESAIWENSSMKTLSRDDQLKYIDVEGMRVVTNIIRCVAEQIKSDTVENVVTGGSKIGEFGKVGKE